MKKISRVLSALMAAMFLLMAFVGCGDTATTTTTAPIVDTTTSAPMETTTENSAVETTTAANVETTTAAPVETTTEQQQIVAPTFDAITDFDYGYLGPKDTPLLVLLVNFDPSLNGNDFEDGEMLLQWSDHSYWHELLFGDGPKTLRAYYETQSGGNFRFIPATESYANAAKKNKANDGIVEVSVNIKMSSSTKQSLSDPERYAALAAAVQDGSVDFSVYDTNKDGKVTTDELMIVYIAAGYESTRSGQTPSYNAHASSVNYSFNGVQVQTNYTKVGEMINGSTPLTVGSFCHELGHNLGNGDLYAAGATGQWGGYNAPAGGASVMAAGGGGSAGKMSGEISGQSPSNFDPYHSTIYGLYDYTSVGDGTYTLYSRQSKQGTYNILKVSTPDPYEYYLIENRYFDESTPHFDATSWNIPMQGIIIWHVDQRLADAGRAGPGKRINSKGTNADIGVAALRPAAEGDDHNPATPGAFTEAGQVFDCRGYAFPGSGTWYTGLTEKQAEDFHLKIEILSNPGHEMSIKITGAPETVSPRYDFSQTSDLSSITCQGQITDLNTQALIGMRIEASETEDFATILSTVYMTPDSKGNFGATVTGLKDSTYYFIRLVLVTENGEFSEVVKVKTEMPVIVNTTDYIINFYRDPESGSGAYEQKAKINEAIVVKFPMKKTGYVFAGWYTDTTYSTYFELADGQTVNNDIDLYARWVTADEAAKLTVVNAKLLNDKANPAGYGVVGETFHEPVPAAVAGKTFQGWYADAALTTPFDFTKTIENNNEVTIYAKWG